MKTTNFMTTRIFTLALAAFAAILIAGGMHISAKAGYFDTAMNATDFFGQFISSENAPTNPDAAGIGVFDWSGGDGNDANWTSNDNWAGVLGAGPGDDLIFPDSAVRKTNTNDFAANTEFSSLTFTGSDYVISGNQISLTNGIVTNPGSSPVPIFNPNILMTASQTFNSIASGLNVTLNGIVNLQSFNLTLTGAGHHQFNGQIAATTGDLFKQGNGTVFLNGNSPNAPQLHVNDGMAQINGAAVWNDSADVDAGATLYVAGDIGNVTLFGGRLISFGTTGTVGAVSISSSGGTIAPGTVPAITSILTSTGAVTNSGAGLATFEFDINGTIAGSQHDRFTSTGGDIILGGANLDLSLGFTPTIGQTFSILTTSGAGNTISGQFAQGGVIVADGQAFAITYNSTSVVLTSLGTSPRLIWDGGGATNNWSEAANWNPNVVPFDGVDLIFPTGVPADSLDNTNNITGLDVGSIAINGVEYRISGNAIALSNGITVNAPAGNQSSFFPAITLTTQAQTFNNTGATGLAIFGTLNLNGFALTVDGTNNISLVQIVSGSGGITKNGIGRLELGGSGNSNTYTGVTTVNNGTLRLNHTNALGATGAGNNTVVANGGSLQIQNGVNTPEAVSLNGNGFGGTGALLSGNCNSPDCSISGAITLTGPSTVNVSNGATLRLSGVISGGFGLTKIGTGTLVLGATNSYSGTTTVNAGTLLANGFNTSPMVLAGGTLGGSGNAGSSLSATGGTIAPGNSPGFLSIGGGSHNMTLNAATTLNIEIGGTTSGTQHDQLRGISAGATGTVNLGGAALTGSLINGFVPTAGQQFTIVSLAGGSLTGQFEQGNSITFGGRAFRITYNASSVVLTALPSISGTVTYGNAIGAPSPRFVSNVTITGSGSPNVSTTTDAPGATAGQYSLSGFGSGSYTVTPTKTGGVNGAISSFDAARIAQHSAGPPFTPLTGNQLVVADVSGNSSVTSFDAGMIAKFVAGPPFTAPGIGTTATWRFNPANKNYASVTNDITGEDYSALLMGEVSGNWQNTGARPVGGGPLALGSGPERSASVIAPHIVTPTDREVIIPVNVEQIASKEIIAYEFDLRYDPSVIQPQKEPIELKGTVSDNLSYAVNAEEPGLLRVAVYGATAIDSDGVLLNLGFTAIGAPGSVSPLTWERLMFNEGDPQAVAADGQVEISKGDPNQAEISGHVLTAMGQGVANARVTLTDTTGKSRSIISNGFGLYRFGDLQVGQTFTISVESRRYAFTPLTVSVTGQQISVDLISEP